MGKEEMENQYNREAKLEFIRAFFDDLRRRSDFLVELVRTDQADEAHLLCVCYIEGLGNNLYWPEQRSKWNFVRVLKEYGGEEALWYVHPKQLRRALADAMSQRLRSIGEKLNDDLAKAEGKLYNEEEMFTLIAPALAEDEAKMLRQNLWRGSLAALAYERIRSQLVHNLGTGHSISFDRTSFRGQAVPELDFQMLYRALGQILQAARQLSVASGTWYGHDFKSPQGTDEDEPEDG